MKKRENIFVAIGIFAGVWGASMFVQMLVDLEFEMLRSFILGTEGVIIWYYRHWIFRKRK